MVEQLRSLRFCVVAVFLFALLPAFLYKTVFEVSAAPQPFDTIQPSIFGKRKLPAFLLKGHDFSVIDGDSIKVDGVKMRLKGVDAPEIYQKCFYKSGLVYFCGISALFELSALIGDGTDIYVVMYGTDRYDRRLVELMRVHGKKRVNLNVEMVKNGIVVMYKLYKKYSNASLQYKLAQLHAINNNCGICAGKFVDPFQYRKGADFVAEMTMTTCEELFGDDIFYDVLRKYPRSNAIFSEKIFLEKVNLKK